jgi:hypothetical protein
MAISLPGRCVKGLSGHVAPILRVYEDNLWAVLCGWRNAKVEEYIRIQATSARTFTVAAMVARGESVVLSRPPSLALSDDSSRQRIGRSDFFFGFPISERYRRP